MFACLLLSAACSRHGGQNPSGNQSAAGGSETGGDQSPNQAEAQTYFDKGVEAYRNDQDQQAVEAFQKAVELAPDFAEAHFRLGLAYEAIGKKKEAEDEYKAAVEAYKKSLPANSRDAKDAKAFYILGQTYGMLHQHEDAVKALKQSVKLDSEKADVFYELGIEQSKLAQYDDAVASLQKSLDLEPGNFRAQEALDKAKEGKQRIDAERKHQEELLKKQKNTNSNSNNSLPPLPIPPPETYIKPKKP